MFRSFLLAGALLAAGAVAAQDDARFEAGASLGALIYQGDLTPSPAGSYRTARPALQLWAAHSLSDRLSVRANLFMGSLHGDDARYTSPAWRQERALSFSTGLTEVSLLAVYRLNNGWALQPYVFGGIGYSFVNVRRDASHFNTTFFADDKRVTDGLATDLARTPARGVPVVPLGAGLRYPIGNALSLYAETAYRLSHTDYLDGFSEVGNPQRFDHYQSYSIGVSYRFGGGGLGNLLGRRGSRNTGCPVLRQ
ncbi:DUF6089 family protein [Flaviaesturariibacter terrae]